MSGLVDGFPTIRLLGLDLVSAELPAVAEAFASRAPQERFGYVVTPNADHFVRLHRDPGSLNDLYQSAGSLLLDSRVVWGIGKALRLPVPPVIPGSDLTLELLEHWIDPDEPITIVGTTRAAVARLAARYRLSRLAHHCPPFGFEHSAELVEQCSEFVELHPSRFVFLACGAPRQEILARRIVQRGRARGIGLCIGAAIDQIGGYENRAPAWLRRSGLEWSWRLVREPRRMGRRYLSNTRILAMMLAEASHSRSSLTPASYPR
jgi:N-acetylglucosaminyldiphosphoundecaprenol N-acetyl-beta-D-mannosaminyltransferase